MHIQGSGWYPMCTTYHMGIVISDLVIISLYIILDIYPPFKFLLSIE